MAETKTTTGTTITTTTSTTTTTTSVTTKKSSLAEYYTAQLEKYKKGELDFDEVPTEAPTPAETTATETAETPVETTTEPATETTTALQEFRDAYSKAVEFCVKLDTEEFCELIRWAKHHHNKFPSYVVELKNMVNADDVYKDAIGKICKPLGEEVCRKAFKLVDSKKILELNEYLKHVKAIVEEWGEI